jgi:hypothetical protein
MARMNYKSERHHALENRYPQDSVKMGRTFTAPPKVRRPKPNALQRFVRWLLAEL